MFLKRAIFLSCSSVFIFFTLLLDNYPISCLYDKYNQIYRYFDDWVVVGREEGKYTFKVKKKEEKHIEIIEW